LVFFIVTQWVVSVQWNYFYKLEYLSLMVVQVGLMALPSIAPEICNSSIYREYSRFALVFGYIIQIRSHVDKYVITKHKKHQLIPLSLATFILD
ncbi:hypothetical protein T12_4561, partial [Trichinella patagoniensis]